MLKEKTEKIQSEEINQKRTQTHTQDAKHEIL